MGLQGVKGILNMSWNKHIFYNYDNCLLNVKQMDILCGDTIYKCCKFIDLMENGNNRYTLYLKNERETKHIVCVFKKSDELTTRTTDVEMRQLLQMLLIIQQQGSLCYYTIMEIFLKKGYYLSKNVFKLLRICGIAKVHVSPRLGTCVSNGRVKKNPRNPRL
jgi:hypothetical protein